MPGPAVARPPVPEVPQQPPRPRRDGRIGVVVDDNIGVGPDSRSYHGGLKICRSRERMAPVRSWRPGQLGIQVDIDGARYVPGAVTLDARRPAKVPPDVDQGRRNGSGQCVGELASTDQRTVRGSCHVSGSPRL